MRENIIDSQTDAVCFSSLLTKFRVWKNLERLLNERHVPYALFSHTRDIWMRDFMPVQLATDRFVTFTYKPSYLNLKPEYYTDWVNWVETCVVYHHYPIANGKHVYIKHPIPKPRTTIKLDGGNVIKCDDCVIISDKVFSENHIIKRSHILENLEQIFSQEVIVIPSDPYEMTGHADGMLRYIGNNTILLNHYIDFDRTLRKRLLKILSPKFNVVELHFGTKKCPLTNWAYINYLQVGSLIIVPLINSRLDDIAIPQIEEIFSHRVDTVPALGVVRLGGGLNCLSWTTKGLVDNIEYDGIRGCI